MAKKSSERRGSISPPPIPIFEGVEYPVIEPGNYMVQVVSSQGPQWVRSYSRWSVRLECVLMEENALPVSMFLNYGNNRERPIAGKSRRSKLVKTFQLMHGGSLPHGYALDPRKLIGKCFRAQVDWSAKDSEGNAKPGSDVYSVITHFTEFLGPQDDEEFCGSYKRGLHMQNPLHPQAGILKQESGSMNHASKQSGITQSS